MMKLKFEELIELPYNVLSLLLDIKEAESKNKSRLYDYEIHKDSINKFHQLVIS